MNSISDTLARVEAIPEQPAPITTENFDTRRYPQEDYRKAVESAGELDRILIIRRPSPRELFLMSRNSGLLERSAQLASEYGAIDFSKEEVDPDRFLKDVSEAQIEAFKKENLNVEITCQIAALVLYVAVSAYVVAKTKSASAAQPTLNQAAASASRLWAGVQMVGASVKNFVGKMAVQPVRAWILANVGLSYASIQDKRNSVQIAGLSWDTFDPLRDALEDMKATTLPTSQLTNYLIKQADRVVTRTVFYNGKMTPEGLDKRGGTYRAPGSESIDAAILKDLISATEGKEIRLANYQSMTMSANVLSALFLLAHSNRTVNLGKQLQAFLENATGPDDDTVIAIPISRKLNRKGSFKDSARLMTLFSKIDKRMEENRTAPDFNYIAALFAAAGSKAFATKARLAPYIAQTMGFGAAEVAEMITQGGSK